MTVKIVMKKPNDAQYRRALAHGGKCHPKLERETLLVCMMRLILTILAPALVWKKFWNGLAGKHRLKSQERVAGMTWSGQGEHV